MINQLREDDRYESIIVIDDDPIVCLMSERINIEVYQAEVLNYIPKQPLSVIFRSSERQKTFEILTLFRNQRVQSKKTVESINTGKLYGNSY